MLRNVLFVFGGLALCAALVALLIGVGVGLVMQLLLLGVVLVAGLAFEKWRYKRVRWQQVDKRWSDTGERFVDPETGVRTAVYFDPATAERHYIAIDQASNDTHARR